MPCCRGDKKGGDDSDSEGEDAEKSKLKSQLEGQYEDTLVSPFPKRETEIHVTEAH